MRPQKKQSRQKSLRNGTGDIQGRDPQFRHFRDTVWTDYNEKDINPCLDICHLDAPYQSQSQRLLAHQDRGGDWSSGGSRFQLVGAQEPRLPWRTPEGRTGGELSLAQCLRVEVPQGKMLIYWDPKGYYKVYGTNCLWFHRGNGKQNNLSVNVQFGVFLLFCQQGKIHHFSGAKWPDFPWFSLEVTLMVSQGGPRPSLGSNTDLREGTLATRARPWGKPEIIDPQSFM